MKRLKYTIKSKLLLSTYYALCVGLIGLLLSCNQSKTEEFVIAGNNMASDFYLDKNVDPLIEWAVNDLADDIETISGNRPAIIKGQKVGDDGVVIGMQSDVIIKESCSEASDSLKDRWEHFAIFKKRNQLCIVGSDVRGTVYGVFELAERIGISPWKWWADVLPLQQNNISINIPQEGITEGPSVQYRGIFLNDEDWGLQPWATHTFEPETGDIGSKTYEKVFQLLLRLKANTIWPAMHPCTKAFYKIPGNNEMAIKYHIVVGTSHCEPMLRNNVDEWELEEHEFNYFENKDLICEYWQERISEVSDAENIITMGMRGLHDGHMLGGENLSDKKGMLEKVIQVQRDMLSSTKNKPLESIAQTMILYKEVLDLYNRGLHVPEDITLMWCDDNHGYIRRLSNKEEQKRSGGSGVYYHLSYWGKPHDYLWLSTVQPALIWQEMTKAYQNGARKIWIANVGDIKPAEYNMEFFLDLAWDIDMVKPENIAEHQKQWMAALFGNDVAEDLNQVMNEHYRLAMLRRPEFMGWSKIQPQTEVQLSDFTRDEIFRRLEYYNDIYTIVDNVKTKLPKECLDAYFQLVEYPVKGAAAMNSKFLYAHLAQTTTIENRREAYAKSSTKAYEEIKTLTFHYNHTMSDGKWKKMMSMKPRNLKVFDGPEPLIDVELKPKKDKKNYTFVSPIEEYMLSSQPEGYRWVNVNGLGYSQKALTLYPFKHQYFEDDAWIQYDVYSDKSGRGFLQLRLLPTHSNNYDHTVSIQVNDGLWKDFKINTRGRSKQWCANVFRNAAHINMPVKLNTAGRHTVRIRVNQTGIILDQLVLSMGAEYDYYEIEEN